MSFARLMEARKELAELRISYAKSSKELAKTEEIGEEGKAPLDENKKEEASDKEIGKVKEVVIRQTPGRKPMKPGVERITKMKKCAHVYEDGKVCGKNSRGKFCFKHKHLKCNQEVEEVPKAEKK